ncbi:MAG: hypothetical protein OHK93_006307 [Ramalina farinacea]|uniref:Heterokaryon incompatibility domain-containing protein n=1 Tax=Ramalina farinacea TaxID=258253 RepID=A0AA43QK00_9LECA|nr:hypothetical protein [Ramalina farinacea]
MSLQQPPHPIFLISVPRSGTNLFMHLFSEHPQLVQKDYSFFNAYLYGPENQRGKELIESDNPSGILVGGPLVEETFQKAYNRLESSIASIIQDQSSPKTVLLKDHTTMLLKTSACRFLKPDWASPSPKIAKAIESVTSPNPALSSSLRSSGGVMPNPTYLPDGFLEIFSPVVLIRHPAITVASLYGAMLRQQEAPKGDELYEWESHGSQTSPRTQWALWEWYSEKADLAEAGTNQKATNGAGDHLDRANGAMNSHLRPIVIDTDLDLLSQPAETIQYLTQRLSIDPAGIIQSWSPTASASDHPGLTAFKGTLLNSAGMMPPKTVSDDIQGKEAKKWEADWGKETLQFREFFDRELPKYAILSHRWGHKEVSFQEMEQNRAPDGSGKDKIKACCLQAVHDGFEWVWIDTCCIDKKSSAELTEAINSMFNWYRKAVICYVHLSDVTSRDEEESLRQFDRSKWFTRGWTLQELLAPQHCLFFNAMWEPMGTVKDFSSRIAEITNIEERFLKDKPPLRYLSVAQRMSWAATRVTTRIEDEAYCLLGIFDINMPLLYGEGGRAFRRLQLEIIKESSDESIFAWGLDVAHPTMKAVRYKRHETSVLAASPRNFGNCNNISLRKGYTRTFSITNLGLKIRVPFKARRSSLGPIFDLELNCYSYDEDLCFPIVLHLYQDASQLYDDQNTIWHRFECHLSTGLTSERYARNAVTAPMNDTKVYLNIQPRT